ncbi:phenylalanine--tRNA ligase subunit beta [Dongia soli]|uniref:Phenylalanine--tRNA ligase beta subunit n=1 Tax=Dongia soli TaxID=600628 RepID=A0ABU5E6Y6_9PROT|nr:phenylalanine--tRNA ligase subunit beta [Dongia soli]MDY0881794.1 phenylalanine--tRNA ligase subunit beta [Dongia soli]
MKFSLSWLKEHLDTSADLETIAKKLTALGLEVEGISDRSKALAPFTVAYVVSAEKHPNADKLRVCMVDTGKGIVQVVCGAPNAKTGMKGVFAPPGSHIPGTGVDLKPGVIRGVESNGMLCSVREMGIGNDHDGIIELPEDAPVGTSFAAYQKLDDPVIEIKLTPDRADCLGVRGIARDLEAAGLGKLKPLSAKKIDGAFDSKIQWRIADDGNYCPKVAGRLFRNVKNGASPKWLQDCLTSIGLRPISALVDITNFVTFDLGRPLHVYDADKLKGDPTLRVAKDGEEILALDGKTYRLDSSMTVIADENGPQSIGGIMGGEATGCSEATTNVFLEVALFNPIAVARTGRKLNINSDARYRFERGVDPTSADWGLDVTTQLILDICGGEASAASIAGSEPAWQRELDFRPARVLGLGGVDVSAATQKDILEKLGFKVSENSTDSWSVSVPSWRADVEGEADLVEEVLRVNDFDNIPVVSMPRTTPLPQPSVTPAQRRVLLTKRLLAGRGLTEAVTFSFMASGIAGLFKTAAKLVLLDNPISSDLDAMRPSILGNLLQAAGRNAARGIGDVALFEVGPTYHDETEKGQVLAATGIRSGFARPRHWEAKPRAVDAFDAKADALAILSTFGVPVDNLQILPEAPGYFHPGRSAVLRLGPTVLGQFGELHPRILKALDLKGAAVGFEVFLDRLPLPRSKGTARPLLNASPFQPVERDFAFVVDAKVPADKLIKAAKGADKALITEVKLFDVFSGGSLGTDQKSIALSVTLQPKDKTLTDQEIEAAAAKVVAAVNKATGGTLRG